MKTFTVGQASRLSPYSSPDESQRQARRVSRVAGFTMIEIALCLAIIGFALVAIIAALPRGLDVEKKNREDTIIGQDATKWMDEIRNGEQGDDDLTNYVIAITNYWTAFQYPPGSVDPPFGTNGTPLASGTEWYTTTGSSIPGFALTNGASIIGILSTPTWTPPSYGSGGNYLSNYIVAYVRAFSGTEVNKPPQANPTILSDAFIYRLVVQNFPYVPVDVGSFCTNCPDTNGLTASQLADRINLNVTESILQTNTHDLRLLFRFPVLPNGEIPSYGRVTFRELATGQMTNYPAPGSPSQLLYFIQPSVYAQQSPKFQLP